MNKSKTLISEEMLIEIIATLKFYANRNIYCMQIRKGDKPIYDDLGRKARKCVDDLQRDIIKQINEAKEGGE